MSQLEIGLASLADVMRGVCGVSSGATEAPMEPSSIPSAWLLSGDARTRHKVLGKTQDKLAYMMLWECGATHFKWRYAKDEFAIILSGDVFITEGSAPERHFGPSDVVFFPAGSEVVWRVPDHIRKVAVLKRFIKQPMAFLVRAWIKFLAMAKLDAESGL